MAITLVQAVNSTGGGNTTSATIALTGVTTGNAIIVTAAGGGQFGTGDFTVADGSNTYTRYVASGGTPGGRISQIWACLNVTTGGSLTITITNTTGFSAWTNGCGAEFSGLDHSGNDVTANNSGFGTASSTGNLSGTTAQAVELEIAITQMNNFDNTGGSVDSFSPAYSALGTLTNTDDSAFIANYRVLSATTNVGCTWTLGGNKDWSASAATFKAAASAATTLNRLLLLGVS